ncbi:RNA-directed DNA polymerase, eukaryota, Reverse transcriptase zinc-binding domain protein [Artemisia annua]|uniref:RNA-directed DNA polymerase, eukaryota, Reverse transcriptase zinc-binding domain protein n=1 Tax=Artemisia annua TaxID=35608 RepID=A0A2U1KW59_ARTAN|nr:RNA-directed DNA polymerase, eukaryota, Reverse transcriptase zinc-binding domain protein [Artemisia annua]
MATIPTLDTTTESLSFSASGGNSNPANGLRGICSNWAWSSPISSDVWEYTIDASRVFSVKGMRSHITNSSRSQSTNLFRCNKILPLKVNINTWRIIHKRAPTRSNLDIRGVKLDSIHCPIYDDETELEEHIFVMCNVAREALDKILDQPTFAGMQVDKILDQPTFAGMQGIKGPKALKQNGPETQSQVPVEINIQVLLSLVSEMNDDKKKMLHPFQLKCFESVIITVARVIWKASNRKIFSSIEHTMKWCFRERHSFCWISSRGKMNLNWTSRTFVLKAKKEEWEQEVVLSRPNSSATTTVVVANEYPPFRTVTGLAVWSKDVFAIS